MQLKKLKNVKQVVGGGKRKKHEENREVFQGRKDFV